MNANEAKQRAGEQVEGARDRLVDLSHRIHANPELAYEERQAAGWLVAELSAAGYDVEAPVGGLETAFVASRGPGPLNVAIIAEYDALPEVGHACGHNIIAATALGAAIGLAAVADEVGLRVSVVGTPAEEGGNGKQALIDAGVFGDEHFALMVHPGPTDVLASEILAAQSLEVTYTGRPAHAGAFPERGINAADGLVIAQVAIGLLRQSLLSSDRVHGIVTVGGEAQNIIPARAEGLWMVRAQTLERMEFVRDAVRRCFEAGALASGASLSILERPAYADMRHDPDLAGFYRANAEALGRTFGGDSDFNRYSTDMGNISYVVPSIHPVIGIDAGGASNHQPEFAAATVNATADQAVVDGSLALVWTAIDAATNAEVHGRLLAR
ncbi:MAG TPA: M20 family metallopeptidase [Candidatus Limnocylindrales bacterium]|nr:M20 family metallopeptidase [Candidatus Limnocylindrales bacterium]